MSDTNGKQVLEWVASVGGPHAVKTLPFRDTLFGPLGVAFDNRGLNATSPVIHVADPSGYQLVGWNPTAGSTKETPTVTGVQPTAVSYGPWGLIFSGVDGTRWTTPGVIKGTIAANPTSLSQDSTGIFFTSGSTVSKLNMTTNAATTVYTNNSLTQVAVDSNDDLIVRDKARISKLNTGTPWESLGSTSVTVGSAGGSKSVGIDSLAGNFSAPWSASTAAPWLHITNPSGTGPATLLFTVDPNLSAAVRSDNIVLDSGLVVTVTQAGTQYTGVSALTTLLPTLTSHGVAADPSANLYLSNYGASVVDLWNAGTQQLSTVVSTGLSGPEG